MSERRGSWCAVQLRGTAGGMRIQPAVVIAPEGSDYQLNLNITWPSRPPGSNVLLGS